MRWWGEEGGQEGGASLHPVTSPCLYCRPISTALVLWKFGRWGARRRPAAAERRGGGGGAHGGSLLFISRRPRWGRGPRDGFGPRLAARPAGRGSSCQKGTHALSLRVGRKKNDALGKTRGPLSAGEGEPNARPLHLRRVVTMDTRPSK